MYDLIYLNNKDDYDIAMEKLWAIFPDAKVNDASDFIHRHRIEICVDINEDDYVFNILECQLAPMSMYFQMMMVEQPQRAQEFIDR